MFLCLTETNLVNKYYTYHLKKSSNLFCRKGGGREKGKISFKGLFFAVQCSKVIGRGKKRVAELFGLRNADLVVKADSS
jgi:hypothetical protein